MVVNDRNTHERVKNALITVYRNDKKRKTLSSSYDDILIKQSRSIIFPTKGAEVTNKLLLTSCTDMKQVLTKNTVPQGRFRR